MTYSTEDLVLLYIEQVEPDIEAHYVLIEMCVPDLRRLYVCCASVLDLRRLYVGCALTCK